MTDEPTSPSSSTSHNDSRPTANGDDTTAPTHNGNDIPSPSSSPPPVAAGTIPASDSPATVMDSSEDGDNNANQSAASEPKRARTDAATSSSSHDAQH
jgi:hypothetical protein